jgi:hypothetical protein
MMVSITIILISDTIKLSKKEYNTLKLANKQVTKIILTFACLFSALRRCRSGHIAHYATRAATPKVKKYPAQILLK